MLAGVVGFGSAGARQAAILESRGFSIAVVRSFKGPTNRPTPPQYKELRSIDDLLKCDPALVVICTPTSSHLQDTLEVISSGIPVLVEKPFVANLTDLARIENICRSNQTFMRVAFHFQFHPAIQFISKRLVNHQVISIRAAWGEYLPSWHPGEDFRLSYAGREDQFGGPILTLSHVLDYCLRFAGLVRTSHLLVSPLKNLGIETEELAILDISHENGALSSIVVDYLTRPTRHQIEIVTSSEIIAFDFQTSEISIRDDQDTINLKRNFGTASQIRQKCFEDQIDHFISLLHSGTIGLDDHDKEVAHVLADCRNFLLGR